MKKTLNIIGYISLFAIPYLLLIFIFEFHDFVKILSLVVLFIIITLQIIHYSKTLIKDIGIRILITIIAISICNFIIYNGYGLVKNIEANKIIQTIEKIEFDGHELYKGQLENKIRFVNSKSIISKGSYDATIYYVDEAIEKTTVQFSGVYIIKIKNDKFYIDTF